MLESHLKTSQMMKNERTTDITAKERLQGSGAELHWLYTDKKRDELYREIISGLGKE